MSRLDINALYTGVEFIRKFDKNEKILTLLEIVFT